MLADTGSIKTTLVCISDFCNRYAVRQEVRETLGVQNEGVQTLTKDQFHILKEEMLSKCQNQKKRAGTAMERSVKRTCIPIDTMEGDTLDYKSQHEELDKYSPDILWSNSDSNYTFCQKNNMHDILISGDGSLPPNEEWLPPGRIQMLCSSDTSSSPAPPIAPPPALVSYNSFLLHSEDFSIRDSSPPRFCLS